MQIEIPFFPFQSLLAYQVLIRTVVEEFLVRNRVC